MINSISGASPAATQAVANATPAATPNPEPAASNPGAGSNIGPAVIVNLSGSKEVNDMAQGDPDHDGH